MRFITHSVVLIAALPLFASAVPLKWTLGNSTFAEGSFEFDDDENELSNIDITTETSGTMEGAAYTERYNSVGNTLFYALESGADPLGDLTGKRMSELSCESPGLTNDGGQVVCDLSELICQVPNCFEPDTYVAVSRYETIFVESSEDLDPTCSGVSCGSRILSRSRMHRGVGQSCISRCIWDPFVAIWKSLGWTCGAC
jgi:hypothetical protein